MLRVITEQHGERFRLDLHGTLGGEWVRVLERHWRSILDAVPAAQVTLVLSNVDFIDPEGEDLLRHMADARVVLVADGCLNRFVIDKLKAGVSSTLGAKR